MKRKDLTGKKFGQLTILGEAGKLSKNKTIYYTCLCSCGNTKKIRGDHLVRGRIISCGCGRGKKIAAKKLENIIGNRYGKLVVKNLSDVQKREGKKAIYLYNCICDCGNEVIRSRGALRNKQTQSCGCLKKEQENVKNGISCLHVLYSQYKERAKKRNKIFELSLEEFESIISSACYYCGTKPSQYRAGMLRSHYKPFLYNGIDRRDNGLGYTKENSVACCRYCNTAKSDRSSEEFASWIVNLCSNFKNWSPMPAKEVWDRLNAGEHI